MSTEIIYVDQLKTLINDYIIPLRTRKMMDEKEINQVFSNIEAIYKLNTQICNHFQQRFETAKNESEETEDDNLMIGDIIPRYAPFLKIYIEYLSNNDQVMRNFRSVYNTKLAKLAEEKKSSFFSLQSLLVLPVQRITRYPLLLKSIFKYTNDNHPDYPSLSISVNVAESICKQINQSITSNHQTDGFSSLILRFESNSRDQLLSTQGRLLLKEGAFTEYQYDENEDLVSEEYHCFLLEEHLVIAYKETVEEEVKNSEGDTETQKKELLFIDSMIELSSLFIVMDRDPYFFVVVSPAGTRKLKSQRSMQQSFQWKEETNEAIRNLLKKSKEAGQERRSLKLYKEKGNWIVEKRSVCYVDRQFDGKQHAAKLLTMEALRKSYPHLNDKQLEEIVNGSRDVKKKKNFIQNLKNNFSLSRLFKKNDK